MPWAVVAIEPQHKLARRKAPRTRARDAARVREIAVMGADVGLRVFGNTVARTGGRYMEDPMSASTPVADYGGLASSEPRAGVASAPSRTAADRPHD